MTILLVSLGCIALIVLANYRFHKMNEKVTLIEDNPEFWEGMGNQDEVNSYS